MSVMILNESTFLRVGKYISLIHSDHVAREWTFRFCAFNIRTYEKRYGERVDLTLHLYPDKVNLVDVPIPAGVQVDADIGAIMYNCSDFAGELDPDLWEILAKLRKDLKASKFYKASVPFKDQVSYV